MYDRNQVDLALLHMLPGCLAARGVAEASLLARAGIGPEEARHPRRYVARAQVCAVLEDLARLTNEPAIGLELGHAAEPERLGAVGAALLSGRTLRECLSGLAGAMPALQDGVLLGLGRSGGRVAWHQRFADSDPERTAVLTEGVATFMLAMVRALVGEPVAAEIAFPHRRRGPASVYEDGLRAPVRFAAPGGACVVSFDADLLDAPNRYRAAAPAPLAPEPARAGGAEDAELLRALDRLIEGLAPTGDLSLVRVAHRLGLSPRSLQRRLAGSGASFERRVDAWRRIEARRRLAETDIPVASLARALGYGDPSHFIRAFRRWEDASPRVWRLRGASAQWREMAIVEDGMLGP